MTAHALVIGVAKYQHIRALPAVGDATDVAAVLCDPASGGYDPQHVVVVQEPDATRARILDELDRLAARAPEDASAFVYFSGHGGQWPDGDSYLMPIDGEWGSRESLDATAISSQLLGDKLAAIRAARLTVVLDCCHAAGLAQPKDVAAWTPELADDALARLGKGRVVMAASGADGRAYVLHGARHGLFTEHLIAGLRGAAGGPDGFVRVFQLYDHVQRNVVGRYPDQRTVLKTTVEDNYVVARCARPGPRLAPPPAAELAYDVLIVHAAAERDRAWVNATLVRPLEERGLRVALEDRDAALGGARVNELERLVERSRFTVPVLTSAFAAGRFENLQTTMALHLGVEDGRARLIPIVREDCEARLAIRMLVSLDMTRDENVPRGIDRLVNALQPPG